MSVVLTEKYNMVNNEELIGAIE